MDYTDEIVGKGEVPLEELQRRSRERHFKRKAKQSGPSLILFKHDVQRMEKREMDMMFQVLKADIQPATKKEAEEFEDRIMARILRADGTNQNRHKSKKQQAILRNAEKQGTVHAKAVDFSKVRLAAMKVSVPQEAPESPQKPLQRPPAQYSNTSPYGIAAELLIEQMKKKTG